jgi:soluble lytic murein transglycosylase-like protein
MKFKAIRHGFYLGSGIFFVHVFCLTWLMVYSIADGWWNRRVDSWIASQARRMGMVYPVPEKTIKQMIISSAKDEGINPGLLLSLAKHESGLRTDLKSKKGALGILQVMPNTGKEYGVKNPKDLLRPEINIPVGARHLRYLLDKYQHPSKALLAWNAGEGNMDKGYKESKGLEFDVMKRTARAVVE